MDAGSDSRRSWGRGSRGRCTGCGAIGRGGGKSSSRCVLGWTSRTLLSLLLGDVVIVVFRGVVVVGSGERCRSRDTFWVLRGGLGRDEGIVNGALWP